MIINIIVQNNEPGLMYLFNKGFNNWDIGLNNPDIKPSMLALNNTDIKRSERRINYIILLCKGLLFTI